MTWSENTHYIVGGVATTFAVPGGFGVGHYIVGENKLGSTFLVSQLAVVGATLLIWTSCPKDGSLSHDCDGQSENAISFMKYPFLGIWAWQIFDIWFHGKSYLQKSGKNISISVDPLNSNLLVRYNF